MAMVIKVLPAVNGMVVRVRNIPLVNTYDTTNTSISTLPEECEYLVVLDLAQRVGLNKIATLTTSELSLTTVAPSVPVLSNATYTNAVGSIVFPVTIGTIPSVPEFTSITLPGMVLSASSAFDTAMSSEDIELASAQVTKLNQGMQEFQTKVQQNLGQFNKDIEKFKADIQKVLDQAKLNEQEAEVNAKLATDIAMQNAIQATQTALANNTHLIQKYQAEVAEYAQKIQAEVGVYGINQSRINIERDRLLALIQSFKTEYYDTLFTKFNIDLRPKKKGE
jgi:hypothetical protein